MSKTAKKESTVRTDLFAVKSFEDVGRNKGAWVYKEIYRTLASARDAANFLNRMKREFPLVKCKIVHPTQPIVDFYVLNRNTIKD